MHFIIIKKKGKETLDTFVLLDIYSVVVAY